MYYYVQYIHIISVLLCIIYTLLCIVYYVYLLYSAIYDQSVVTTPPLEVLTSSFNGGSIEGERGNVTLSHVTPPICIGHIG